MTIERQFKQIYVIFYTSRNRVKNTEPIKVINLLTKNKSEIRMLTTALFKRRHPTTQHTDKENGTLTLKWYSIKEQNAPGQGTN